MEWRIIHRRDKHRFTAQKVPAWKGYKKSANARSFFNPLHRKGSLLSRCAIFCCLWLIWQSSVSVRLRKCLRLDSAFFSPARYEIGISVRFNTLKCRVTPCDPIGHFLIMSSGHHKWFRIHWEKILLENIYVISQHCVCWWPSISARASVNLVMNKYRSR